MAAIRMTSLNVFFITFFIMTETGVNNWSELSNFEWPSADFKLNFLRKGH